MGHRIRLAPFQHSLPSVRFCQLLCALAIATLLVGCGGSNSSNTANNVFPQAAASQFASQLAGAVAQGMISSSSAAVASGNVEHPNQVNCTQTPCPVNIPLSFTLTCSSGGSMQLTGSIDGSLNGSGTGMIDVQAVITITNWACVQGFIINGNPDITITGMFSFVNGAPANTQTIQIGGGFSWGSSPAEVCTINLTINFSTNGTGGINGTFCGNQININFSAAQALRGMRDF